MLCSALLYHTLLDVTRLCLTPHTHTLLGPAPTLLYSSLVGAYLLYDYLLGSVLF
jgi:hypothetical protein